MTSSAYLDPELLRTNLELEDDTFADKLAEIAAESNQEVDVQLKPFAPEIPLAPDNIQFGQARKCALHYARMLWFNNILEHDIEEKERKRYEDKLKPIIQSFKADRNARTISVVAGSDPTLEKVYMPAQRDSYLDIFG